jgi:uncharacterized protein YdiU (UPF0061 family)
MGRYAYGNQPKIALWNLTRVAEKMLPLLSEDETKAIGVAEEALATFSALFQRAYQDGFRRKLGLGGEREGDPELIGALLEALSRDKVDFTLFFRRLSNAQLEGEGDAAVRAMFADAGPFEEWLTRWRLRLHCGPLDVQSTAAAMQAVNPAFIPRNHRVEAMISAAVERENFAPFEELLAVLSRPFDDQPEFLEYQNPPLEEERVLATFCGT